MVVNVIFAENKSSYINNNRIMILRKIKRGIVSIVKACKHKSVIAIVKPVPSHMLLEGKVALITGGTSGIGKAIAKEFLESGAYVVITSRSEKRARTAAAEIDAAGNNVLGVALDVTAVESFENVIDDVLGKVPGGKIDILVNNAGLVGGDIRNCSEEEFDDIVATNIKGVFFLSKVVMRIMITHKIKGNILNVASSSSQRPAISAYMISKWGVRGFTEGLAKMAIPYGIVVNGVAPGPTATPMLRKNDYNDVTLESSPIRRYILPEEVAEMALFLAGPQGRSIVGDVVYMTGGAGIVTFDDVSYSYEH